MPDRNYALEMGRLGHVSLTVDRLGYDASGHPDGLMSCFGSAADVASQIISQLRSGQYSLAGTPPVHFSKVVLAGHDVGGAIAEIEAYSYQNVDGLILMDWADQGFSQARTLLALQAGTVCAQGGQPASDGNAGNYVDYGSDDDLRNNYFRNAEPAVVEAAVALRNRNPCGELSSLASAPNLNRVRVREITRPVLLIYGRDDPAFSEAGVNEQKTNFSGNPDVTLLRIDNTGHAPMLERTAAELRAAVSAWLGDRQLGG